MFRSKSLLRVITGITIWLILILAPNPALAKPQKQPLPSNMGLADLIDWGLQRSPELAAQKQSLKTQKLQMELSYSQLFPRIDLASSLGASSQDPSVIESFNNESPWDSSTQIGLNANLYNNHQDWTAYQVAQIEYQSAQVRYQKARNQWILNLTQQFYQLSELKVLAEIAEQKLELIRKQFIRVNKEYRGGVKPRRDFLRFQAQLKRADLSLFLLKSQIKTAKISLLESLGLDPRELDLKFDLRLLEISKDRPVPEYEIDLSTEDFYDVKVAALDVQVQQQELRQTKRARGPRLFADASIEQNYRDYIGPESTATEFTSWRAGLTLKWNLFDFGREKKQMQISQSQMKQSRSQFTHTKNQVAEKIATLLVEAKTQKESLELSRTLFLTEEETFQTIQREYRLGTSSYLDFISSLEAYLEAKGSFQSSFFDYLSTIAEIHYYKGDMNVLR